MGKLETGKETPLKKKIQDEGECRDRQNEKKGGFEEAKPYRG